MEAANNLTVLEVVYDGYPRMVEPYSLTFKQRRDGFGQEYFYVYDRTGGRTSGPGIKTFLHTKVQTIKTTTQSFEPRFPIELGKAGEFAGRTFFGSPSVAPRIRRRSSSISTHIYVVECSYCGKRFPRKKYSVRLRKHKDRYGNECYGRSGYIAY